MTRILIAVLLAASGGTPLPAFVSQQGAFSIRFPAEPTFHNLPIDDNPVAQVRYLYTVADKRAVYMVQYVDLTIPAETSEEEAFRSSKENTSERAAVLGGSIVSERRIRRGGYPGRDWVVRSPDGSMGLNRVILVDRKRLYSVIFSGRPGVQIGPNEGRSFVESFKYIGPSKRTR
jgi:hypothetical protein